MLLLIVWLLASLSTFFFFSNPTFHIQKVDGQCQN